MKKITIVLLIGLMPLILQAQKAEGTVCGKIPLYFIANKGQVNPRARFYTKTSLYTLWMTEKGLVFDSSRSPHSPYSTYSPKYRRDVSRLIFLNANKNPVMVPVDIAGHRVNFLKGRDPSKWRTGISTSKAIMYKNLYSHIDLKVYGIEREIEYDWLVKPGGNPGDIRFEYRHVKGTRLDDEGNLLIETEFGQWIHKKPVAYQSIKTGVGAGPRSCPTGNKNRVDVEVTFKKVGKNTYGFKVGDYDTGFELIIDPVVLVYSTYFGGSGWENATGIAVDSSGSVYVTGYTESMDFPVENPFQENLRMNQWGSGHDVFITKLSPGGNAFVYSTFLGGGEGDAARGIAVDSSGSVYVAGDTGSVDFPVQNPFQENLHINQYGYGQDTFIMKLSPSGNTLVYSTLLGGNEWDEIMGITVDSSGSAYVTGNTDSMDFPTENPFQENLQAPWGYGKDAFITKLSPSGSTLVYSTYLGGSYWENAFGIAVDSSGNAYVTGGTESDDFPTSNPFQENLRAQWGYGSDAFITKLSPTGDTLVYSTYLGGNDWDSAGSIAVDNSGNAYVAGITYSLDFPVVNPFQLDRGHADVFVTKLAPSGGSLIYSTYLGGSYQETAGGIAVDSTGNAYVTGGTQSVDFPAAFAFQENLKASGEGEVFDAFITKLSPTGNTLFYSSFLGGSDWEEGSSIALDSFGNAYVTGDTYSPDFPVKNPHQQFREIVNGNLNVFVSRIQNIILTLQASRQEERTWLIRKQYAEICLNVVNPADNPVSNYIIYRKESAAAADQYQAIKEVSSSDFREGAYTYYDLLPQTDKSYTYKAEALDANGAVIGASEEQTI